MRVLSAKVENFGSYKELAFDFTRKGLALISGPTGAGKSTLCDVIPWILFGATSKGGTVDEIRNWSTEAPTTGTITLDLNGNLFQVIRSRKPNDLAIWEDGGVYRGKDLTDTQKIINNKLGLTAELYLSGAYFHEFSQSAQFFTTTAKNRRLITEQIVDLTLAKKINETVAEYKKGLKLELDSLEKELLIAKDRYTRSVRQEAEKQAQIAAWHDKQAAKIRQAKANYDNFELNKKRAIDKINASVAYESEQYSQVVNSIRDSKNTRNEMTGSVDRLTKSIETCDTEVCEHCGSPKQNDKRRQLVRDLQRFESELTSTIADLKHYDSNLRRLEISIKLMNDNLIKERAKENTWSDEYEKLLAEKHPFGALDTNEIKDLAKNIEEIVDNYDIVEIELSDLSLLGDVTDQFRGLLIKNTIVNLENYTNKLLTNHFDAEIRVGFSATDADKLDVTIYKDGHQASFTQLSKGQRQLLKLCFGVSIMRAVANHNGISFNCVFLDEVFNGMDENLKAKGFNLLQQLSTEYESVFAIDHSEELKARFTSRFDVELSNGESQINHA